MNPAMECLVYRVPMRDPGDASGIIRLIDDGALAPGEIVAIFGKTEGNGCVNDFTRGYALSALSAALAPLLGVAAAAIPGRIAMIMSGGTSESARCSRCSASSATGTMPPWARI